MESNNQQTNFQERILKEIDLYILKSRLSNFFPAAIFQILENNCENSTLFEESDDCVKEVKTFLEILQENCCPEPVGQLYINFPIAILDFKDLFVDQCPQINPHQVRSMRQQYIEEVNLSLFNFPQLRNKLTPLLRNECEFLQQVSTILTKLMQGERLNDGEN